MDTESSQEQAIFESARRLSTAQDRAECLGELCGDDVQLRKRVEALLSVYDEEQSFLESPAMAEASSATFHFDRTEQLGDYIGPYKLLQQIGEGGMGTVYMAEQTRPVERRVALKVIKPGMDTRAVVARFEAERQALALMDHPNIAKVLDAGTTEQGRPYFVMELVKGEPITEYCDRHKLSLRARLELFAPVCHAVQHAHQKGIVHRDIKPSNVLVTRYDDRPVSKVIDFGVAKAIDQRLTEKTLFTEFGQVVGTPEYMSPEQACLNQLDIDTRTDIYSLGVLLYELLAGETPFDRARLRSAAFDELLRIIREEEPPRPSLRLTTSEALPSIAANRHIEPKRLGALIRGELDWIVMKALEKDRSRRYETASNFADDVQRFLADEPVKACPPSAAYRCKKFARKHRAILFTAAMVFSVLLCGVAVSTWQAIRATRAEHAAEMSLAAERVAHEETEQARLSEMEQRRTAESAMLSAQAARQEAQSSAETTRQSLVRQYVRKGTDHVQRGDYTLALPWFVKALENDQADPARERIHRLRIATTLDRCPKLTQAWFPHFSVHTIDFFADGQRVLLVGGQRAVVMNIRSSGPPLQQFGCRFAKLSPDKQHIVRISESGMVELLDTDSLAVSLTLTAEGGDALRAGFSADGRRLFVVYDGKLVRIFDTSTGEPASPILKSGEQEIVGVKFSPNGRYLVVADKRTNGKDQIVVWDVQAAQVATRISTPSRINSNYGKEFDFVVTDEIVAMPMDVFVLVANLSDGMQKHLLRQGDAILRVSISSDGSRFLTASVDGSANIWDVQTGESQATLPHSAAVMSSSFSDSGELAVTGSSDGEIRLWDVRSGQRAFPILRQPHTISMARFTPDQRYLIAASWSQDVCVWDLAAGLSAPVLTRRHHKWSMGAQFSPDGQLLAVGCLDYFVRLYDLQAGRLAMQPLRHTYFADFNDFSPDGRTFLTSSADGIMTLRNMSNGQPIFQNRLLSNKGRGTNYRGELFGQTHVGADFDSAGERIYVHSVKNKWLHILSARTGEDVIEPIKLDLPIQAWQVYEDEGYCVIGLGEQYRFEGSRVEIRDLRDMSLLKTFPVDSTPYSVQRSHDGKRLLIAGGRSRQGSGFAQVWDIARGEPLTPLIQHHEAVFLARFVAEDRQILTNCADGIIRLWDSHTGVSAAPECRVGRKIAAMKVHPDETWMATGTGNNNAAGVSPQYVQFWEISSGEPISPPAKVGNTIVDVDFAPDGHQLAVTSRDFHLRVWDIPEETRPIEDLSAFARLVSGVEIDKAEAIKAIDVDTFKKLWTDLREKYPDEFMTSTAEQIAWFRERAQYHNFQKQFEQAVLDLDRLIELDPNDPELYERRIAFNKRLRRWDTIRADARQVIALESREGAELAEFAQSIAQMPDVVPDISTFAIELANQAVAQAPQEAHTYFARGEMYAHWRRWAEAEADLAKTVDLEPHNNRPWYELAVVQLAQGKVQEYHSTCERMLAAIPFADVHGVERLIAWTCGLHEGALDNLAEVMHQRKWIATPEAISFEEHSVFAMVSLRAGNLQTAFDEFSVANEVLNEPSSNMEYSPAYAWYGLAITCHQLGRTDEAETWLKRANEWTDKTFESFDAPSDGSHQRVLAWNRRVTLELLRKEAESALEDVP